jgi:hypothetical protein
MMQPATRTPLRYAGEIDTVGMQIANTVAALHDAELVAMDRAIIKTATTPSAPADGNVGHPAAPTSGVVYQEHDAVLHRLFDA